MNDPIYNYKINLRPLDYFFFGGEQTFGSGNRANYFAKSKVFPQQTTILGVLRHLGIKNNLAIGASFNKNEPTPDYGFIKSLSPVFLQKGIKEQPTYFLPGPLGDSTTGFPYSVTKMEAGKKMTASGFASGYMAADFNPKLGMSQKLIPDLQKDNKTQLFVDTDDVLRKDTIIGIKKMINDGSKNAEEAQKDQQDGFFKQEVVRMTNDWSFTVLAKLETDGLNEIPTSMILPIGGQKMLWKLTLEKLDDKKQLSQYFSPDIFKHAFPKDLNCLMLTSDAFLSKDFYQYIKFAITDTKDFRYIHTPEKVKNFARMKSYLDWGVTPAGASPVPPIDQLYKSQKYNLIRRGSLLYGDTSQLRALLDQQPWQTIGYNHYFEIEKL